MFLSVGGGGGGVWGTEREGVGSSMNLEAIPTKLISLIYKKVICENPPRIPLKTSFAVEGYFKKSLKIPSQQGKLPTEKKISGQLFGDR